MRTERMLTAAAGAGLAAGGAGAAGGGAAANVAPADCAPAIVTVHVGAVPAGAQAPLQPASTRPGDGRAVSVTCAPALMCWKQSVAHAIPSGSLVTVPP
ncbi:MAG: hypothetical protein QOH72_4513, partial [Solirubrobacteraceae bacterium]|nr:hypothetical protein [Solirubrobacteraceae bacterium]